jgi:hypothetical protein
MHNDSQEDGQFESGAERRRGLRNHLRSRFERYDAQSPLPRGMVSVRLVIGITIVIMGVLSFGGAMGILDSRSVLYYYFWPSIFASIGISMLIAPTPRADGRVIDRRWAFVWLFVSLWLFAYQWDWIDLGFWQLVFPLLLFFIGGRIIQRALQSPESAAGQSPGDQSRIYAFLSGSEMRTFTQPVKDMEIVAVLSGVKLDLATAQIEGDKASLQVTAFMGGIEIYAPSDWNIVSDVMPILGAFVDKRRPTAVVPTKTLHIGGIVLMGGVEVKN